MRGTSEDLHVSDPSVALGIRISITQMNASHAQMGGLRAGEAQQGPDGPYHGDNLGSTDTPFGAAQRQVPYDKA